MNLTKAVVLKPIWLKYLQAVSWRSYLDCVFLPWFLSPSSLPQPSFLLSFLSFLSSLAPLEYVSLPDFLRSEDTAHSYTMPGLSSHRLPESQKDLMVFGGQYV